MLSQYYIIVQNFVKTNQITEEYSEGFTYLLK